jgi:ribose/xylose/arabinose/galactoside ABC-type transport system permease subunit
MDNLDLVLAILVGVILIVGAWLVVSLRAGRVPGTASLVLAWIVLTAVTLAVGWLIAYMACYALLFTLGAGAAAIGFLVAILLTEATPSRPDSPSALIATPLTTAPLAAAGPAT